MTRSTLCYRRGRLVAPIALLTACVVVLAGCGSLKQGGSESADGPIKIATVLPLTSPSSAEAKLLLNGYRMAIQEANKSGQLPGGRKIELLVKDDKFDPARAKRLTRQQIARNNVTAVLGSFGSATSLTQSEEAQSAGVPGIYPFASAPKIVQRGYEYVFSTYPLSAAAERSFDNFLLSEVNPDKVAIFYADNAFSIAGAEESREMLEKNGVEVPVFEKYAMSTTDFTQLVAQAKSAGVDVLKNIGYGNHYVSYIQAVAQVRPTVDVVYMETQYPFEPRYQQAVGDLLSGIFGTATWYPGVAPEFAARYQDKYGKKPQTQAVFGYSAARVLIEAIKKAGTSRDALQKALETISVDTPMGQISFDDRGAWSPEFPIGQLIDGGVNIVWPKEHPEAVSWEPTSVS